MTRVRIRGGYLTIGRRKRPGHPDIGLPVEPEHPDNELPPDEEDGEYPDHELPSPPPGIWPPPTIGHPIHPIAPGDPSKPGHLPAPPPGSIWPRPASPVEGLFVVLAHVPDHGWHYIVVDPDAWPKPVEPTHPIAPGDPAVPQPKRA